MQYHRVQLVFKGIKGVHILSLNLTWWYITDSNKQNLLYYYLSIATNHILLMVHIKCLYRIKYNSFLKLYIGIRGAILINSWYACVNDSFYMKCKHICNLDLFLSVSNECVTGVDWIDTNISQILLVSRSTH